MRRFLPIISCLVVLSLFAAASSLDVASATEVLSPAHARAVDDAIRAEMERQQAVGAAVGVLREGRVVYLKGYGHADREAGVPVTEKTLFRWASISKTLTAVAAMQLVEQGVLDLDADVRSYVPEFPDKGVAITPRQLLCHQGGIVHYSNGRVIRTRREYDTPHPFEDVILALDTFKESPLIAPPGTKDSYTTHGFILLSAVVERAGGEKFADQVRRRICEPLGLATLRPDYQWESIDHRAVGYQKRRGRVVRSTDTDVSWKLGGGGYLSSIGDMASYAAGLLNGRLVSSETEQAMWTAQETSDGRTTGRGLGFFLGSRDGAMEVSHNGGQEKTKTRLVIYPREGNGIVFMTNSENANPTQFVDVIQRALDETPGDILVGPIPTDSGESSCCRPSRPRRPCLVLRLRHGRCAR